MKITDPQVIEDGEKDLINAVQEDLDLDAVRQILKERMAVSTLASKGGQIVVHNNKIAFRLDFDINLSGSLLFDRQGNYIDAEAPLTGEDMNDSLEDRLDAPPNDGIPLVETGLAETDPTQKESTEQEREDDLSIGLPEYDLEDESEPEIEPIDQDEADTQNLETENLETENLETENLETENLETENLETESLETENLETERLENESLENESLENESLENESLENNDLGEETELEMLDDDINDDDISGILKESREFWDQKKDS